MDNRKLVSIVLVIFILLILISVGAYVQLSGILDNDGNASKKVESISAKLRAYSIERSNTVVLCTTPKAPSILEVKSDNCVNGDIIAEVDTMINGLISLKIIDRCQYQKFGDFQMIIKNEEKKLVYCSKFGREIEYDFS